MLISWILFARCVVVIVFFAGFSISAIAADVEIVDLEGNGSGAYKMSAVVADNYFGVSVSLPSTSQIEMELDKCEDVIPLMAEANSDLVYDAVSSRRVQIVLTEQRNKPELQRAWRSAFERVAKDENFKFDFDDSVFELPQISDLTVTFQPEKVRRKDFLKEQDDSFRRLLNSSIIEQLKAQLGDFNTSGTLRFSTNSQVLVCYLLNVETASINLQLFGRTYDRLSIDEVLDRKCLISELDSANQLMRRAAFNELVATVPAVTAFTLGTFFSHKVSLCIPGKGVGLDNERLSSAWKMIIDAWVLALENSTKNYLTEESVYQLTRFSSIENAHRTSVDYTMSRKITLR